MKNLLKYTVPTWNDNIYDSKYATLDINTSDSVIRIFGMLNEDADNEGLMYKILNDNSTTISISELVRFIGGDHVNLNAVYDYWTNMEAKNNAPHIVLGIYAKQTYCAWIDSWTNPNQMILRRINPDPEKNRLPYLTKTPGTSSLLALSMLNNTAHGWMWKDNIEYRSLNIVNRDILVTYRYDLNPVPIGNPARFNDWTIRRILISLHGNPAYKLFDAQVCDPELAPTGVFGWVQRPSVIGETCTLAADQWTGINQYIVVGDSVVAYITASCYPVSKMMNANYKGVYTTSGKDTVFINGSYYQPTSLLKYTDQLLRIDLSTLITVDDFVFNITTTDKGYNESEHIFQYDFTVAPTTALSSKITLSPTSVPTSDTWSVTDYGPITDARLVRFKVVDGSSFTTIDVEVKYECRDGSIINKEITKVIIS